ncbi:unnamed protein product [Gongylonema pulchrum]|uniref:SnoaL-like domain-containing protein n=1 Tax=Gongylonema pulchrum TaxID=637853 RepID=A0A183DBK4_9BILA|nr:unnamed protein product [Gongylonema pulchrum]
MDLSETPIADQPSNEGANRAHRRSYGNRRMEDDKRSRRMIPTTFTAEQASAIQQLMKFFPHLREQLETATFKTIDWDDDDEHVHLTYEIGGTPFAHNDQLCSRQGLITPAGTEKLISGLQYFYNAPIESRLENVQPIAR